MAHWSVQLVRLALLLTASAAALSGCRRERGVLRARDTAQAGVTQQPVLGGGTHQIAIRHGGRDRRYIVFIPPRALVAPAPLLLAFHGGGGNPQGFRDYAGLDAIAAREGFIVAYPFGSGPLPNRLLTWNAGDNCCGFARNNNVDDVGFAAAVVDDLAQRIQVDRTRVYATGHSNGGILTHRIAAARPDLVAAVVPVAGALDLADFSPALPVPLLHIHSVDDPRALYHGGIGPPFPGTDSRVLHSPVPETLRRWRQANGCGDRPDTTQAREGGSATPNSGQSALLLVWSGCTAGAEVAHWELHGVGHGWPGGERDPLAASLVGRPTTLVLAAEEIWSFMKRFERR